jgi:putative hydroxymethylpyrimidine transport system substrate-binding protein
MRNVDVPEIELQGKKITAFFPEDNGIPSYSVLIFVTNAKNTKDPRIPRFLAAIKEAVEYLDLKPQEGWTLFSKAYPEANNAINHEAWFATLPYFSEDPAGFYAEDWKKFADFMKNNNMIKKTQPISHYAVVLR